VTGIVHVAARGKTAAWITVDVDARGGRNLSVLVFPGNYRKRGLNKRVNYNAHISALSSYR